MMNNTPGGLHTPPAGGRRVAVVVGDGETSYARLERDVQRFSQWLDAHWRPGWHLVAVCIRHPYWHWVANLALMRRAVASVSLAQGQLQLPLPVDVCLADGSLQAAWPVLPVDVSTLASGAEGPKDADDAPAWQWGLHPEAGRWVLTSGTTGRPKIIAIGAADLDARMRVGLQNFGDAITADTQMLNLMGVDTLGGLMLTLLAWLAGGTVLMGEPPPSGEGLAKLPYARSTFLLASPAGVSGLLSRTDRVWPGRDRRQVHVGGARLHALVRDEALRKIGYQVMSHYGASETGMVATCDARLLDQNPGLAGKVLADTQVQVVDASGVEVPHGHTGRVRCKKPGMAHGYQGEAHSPQFLDGWFYPGDLGTLSADGWLTITGRDDDLINVGGLKISAVDLETQWLHLPGVRDICVVVPGTGLQQRLAVAVVLDDGADPAALGERIAATLPQGAQFVLVRRNALPRNAMGKLERLTIAQQMAQLL